MKPQQLPFPYVCKTLPPQRIRDIAAALIVREVKRRECTPRLKRPRPTMRDIAAMHDTTERTVKRVKARMIRTGYWDRAIAEATGAGQVVTQS